MAVMRLIVVAIIVSALSVVAHAQEGKPCPSGHICPVCSEENGVRTCRVERPGQPALPTSGGPDGATGYLAAERRCAIATTAAPASGISIRTVCYPFAVRRRRSRRRGRPDLGGDRLVQNCKIQNCARF
jgi:hypothetical protein